MNLVGAACLLGEFKGGVVLVDADDIPALAPYRWRSVVCNRTRSGEYTYVVRGPANGMNFIHRFLTQAPDGLVVDHLNGDRLDNRKCNLRVCTHQQNMVNRKFPVNNTSGYRGVSWSARHGKWRAGIKRFGKTRHLGFFEDRQQASAAYERARAAIDGGTA